jgi:hypothetical protein
MNLEGLNTPARELYLDLSTIHQEPLIGSEARSRRHGEVILCFFSPDTLNLAL